MSGYGLDCVADCCVARGYTNGVTEARGRAGRSANRCICIVYPFQIALDTDIFVYYRFIICSRTMSTSLAPMYQNNKSSSSYQSYSIWCLPLYQSRRLLSTTAFSPWTDVLITISIRPASKMAAPPHISISGRKASPEFRPWSSLAVCLAYVLCCSCSLSHVPPSSLNFFV